MISRIIDALQTLQREQAHSALNSPKQGDPAFEFGHAAGVYQGLQMALNAIENALSQDDEDEHDHGTKRRGGQPYLRT